MTSTRDRRPIAVASAILFFLSITLALAHSGATGVVKERMAAMEDIGAALKTVGLMVRGLRDFDGAVVKASASTIAGHAAAIPTLFPAGSDHHPSEAAAAIWTDWERFVASAGDLTRHAEALARKADGAADASAIRAEFAAVAQTCKSCHEAFRVKR